MVPVFFLAHSKLVLTAFSRTPQHSNTTCNTVYNTNDTANNTDNDNDCNGPSDLWGIDSVHGLA